MALKILIFFNYIKCLASRTFDLKQPIISFTEFFTAITAPYDFLIFYHYYLTSIVLIYSSLARDGIQPILWDVWVNSLSLLAVNLSITGV